MIKMSKMKVVILNLNQMETLTKKLMTKASGFMEVTENTAIMMKRRQSASMMAKKEKRNESTVSQRRTRTKRVIVMVMTTMSMI